MPRAGYDIAGDERKGTAMQTRNVMEDLVAEVLSECLRRAPEVCACERCLCDMTAFALNNLPPRYMVVEVEDPSMVPRERVLEPFREDARYSARAALQMVSARPRHASSQAGRRSRPE